MFNLFNKKVNKYALSAENFQALNDELIKKFSEAGVNFQGGPADGG